MKKCQFCAEEIQDEAIKCKHCGSSLQNAGHTGVAGLTGITPKLLSPKSLLSGETLYFETRPFALPSYTATILLILISLFTISASTVTIPFWIIVLPIAFFVNRVQWKNKVYAITSKRIITQQGVLGKDIKQCPLDKVQNIKVSVFWYNNNIGDIFFDTAGGPLKELSWVSVKNPKDVHTKISDIIHK